MPPKKDDKKKGKDAGTVPTLCEIDPTHYIRKPTPIAESNVSEQKIYRPYKGKIVNIDELLPIWPETLQENWGEAVSLEASPEIKYPSYLEFEKHVPAATYFGLDAGEPMDPKTKGKKEVKKPPAKGKEEVVAEVVETLINENGIAMPVVYQAESDEWSAYPPLRMSNRNDSDLHIGADSLMSDVFSMIARFAPNIAQLVVPESSSTTPAIDHLHQNYLWRAIYPKLSGSNKPVYNAQGKHVIKLYIRDAWRKITVTDSIPVQANGRPCLATTTEKLELWPLLLSKALYTAYTASGVNFLDLSDASCPIHEKKCMLFTFAMQALTGWNPHEQRLQWPQMLISQPSKSVDLLMHMLHQGVPLIKEGDVLMEDDCFRFNLPGEEKSSNVQENAEEEEEEEEEESEGNLFKTKRKFKEEYQARKSKRDDIVRRILERERRVNVIDDLVKNTKPAEAFYILREQQQQKVQQNPANLSSVSAILGLVLPQDKNPLDVIDIAQVRLLLQWHRKPALTVTPNTKDPMILGKGKYAVAEFLQAFPEASPVEYEWCALGDLISASEPESGSFWVHLLSLFTGTSFSYQVDWSHRWVPYVPPASATDNSGKDAKNAKKDVKDKNGKNKNEIDANTANDGIFAEPPPVPPTFLKINITELKKKQETEQEPCPQQYEDLSLEEKEALAMQEAAIPSSSSSLKNKQKKNLAVEIDLTVTISADLIKLLPSDATSLPPSEIEAPPMIETDASSASLPRSRPATAPPLAENSNNSEVGNLTQTTDNPQLPKSQPSDTLLILQEILLPENQVFGTTNTRVPRVYVLKMSEFALIPTVTQLIRLSVPIDNNDSNNAIFFWVRLFTRASVNVRFESNALMSMDLAETLWQQQDTDSASVLVETGECGACVLGVDQPLLRLPLISPSLTTSESASVLENAMVFLHVSDPSVAPHVDLSFMTLDTEAVTQTGHGHAVNARQFPAIQGVLAPYAVTSSLTDVDTNASNNNINCLFPPCPVLLATLRNTPEFFHQHSFIPPLTAPLSETSLSSSVAKPPVATGAELPPFQWKLVILTRRKLASVTEIFSKHPSQRTRAQEHPMTQRFEGVYVPNQAFRLFRDVYTLDKNMFPLSVKLSLAKLPKQASDSKEPEEEEEEYDDETPQFALRFYRRHDEVLLAEHNAHDVLEIQWQDLGLLDDPANPSPVATVIPATTASTGKPPGKTPAPAAKGGKGSAVDTAPVVTGSPIDVLVECVLLLPSPELDPFGYDRIYRKYFSRYPHVFDGFYSIPVSNVLSISASSGNIPANVTEEEALSGSALNKETMALQRTFLRPTPIHEQPAGSTATLTNNNNNTNNGSRPLTASFRTLPGHVYLPPQTPLLHWRLDWQAGKVLQVSHDTALLMKFQALKQSWETLPDVFTVDGVGRSNNSNASNVSRYQRAQAALHFLRASTPKEDNNTTKSLEDPVVVASASNKSLPPSRPATAPNTNNTNATSNSTNTGSLSQSSLEQLATALLAPGGVEEMQKRYAALFSAMEQTTRVHGLGDAEVVDTKYMTSLDSLIAPNRSTEDAQAMGSDAWRALVDARRHQDAADRETHYQKLLSFAQDTLTVQRYQQECLQRITATQQRLQEQRKGQVAIWEEREKIREDYETKNQALYQLLKRAKEAKANAAAAEAAAEAERLKLEAKNAKGKKK